MYIKLLGSESMGTRSMACYVETSDVKVMIDPGCSLAPLRYGLRPHPLEIEELKSTWRRIVEYSEKSDMIVITHYHFDHFSPNTYLFEIYSDKLVYLKDYRNNINPSQIRRSRYFLHRLEELGIRSSLRVADGTSLKIGNTFICFSKPVLHGYDERLGYVVMVYVKDDNDSFMYTSDVEGGYDGRCVEFIVKHNPDKLYVDGPITYIKRAYEERRNLDKCLNNLAEAIKGAGNLSTVIIDHHLLRDINYKEWINNLVNRLEGVKRGIKIMSAAEYMGLEVKQLEAYRPRLYEKYPVG